MFNWLPRFWSWYGPRHGGLIHRLEQYWIVVGLYWFIGYLTRAAIQTWTGETLGAAIWSASLALLLLIAVTATSLHHQSPTYVPDALSLRPFTRPVRARVLLGCYATLLFLVLAATLLSLPAPPPHPVFGYWWAVADCALSAGLVLGILWQTMILLAHTWSPLPRATAGTAPVVRVV